jgi:4a-hydroxytetrahydrobiopterin dehydratase
MTAIDVTFYTRRNCSLCDKAKEAIAASGVPVRLQEIDIDRDEHLRSRFNDDVPVVFINGLEAFRHRVDPEAFRRFAETCELPDRARGLAGEKCIPCRGGVPALKGDELEALTQQLGGGWSVIDEHHLEKTFPFPDFSSGLAFTNAVAAIAEAEGHHPDIHLAWGRVVVDIWTHAIDGLTRSDFVLAAKIDDKAGARG